MRTPRRKHIPKPMKIRAECSEVNTRLEEMRKEDAERMTLALTILTVGVAGPIASVLVKDKAAKVFEKLAENLQGKASQTALEAAGEMVKDSAGDLTKKGTGEGRGGGFEGVRASFGGRRIPFLRSAPRSVWRSVIGIDRPADRGVAEAHHRLLEERLRRDDDG
jgi:hypothetical protein